MSHLEAIRKPVNNEVLIFEKHFRDTMKSNIPLLNIVTNYLLRRKGKQIRPLFVFLTAGLAGGITESTYNAASLIELLHTASLIHDDVVDESELRRGNETANALFGNAASVLVGDFLYSRAFEMMVDIDDMRVMQILAKTTNVIAEGEVMQLMNVHDAETTEAKYLEVIFCKTAKLFEAATQLGAVLCQRNEEEVQAMAAYGRYLGTAFQLIDDVMDYSSNSEQMGKNVGDDLAEGKPTLPLIYAIQQGTPEQAAVIKSAIEKGGYDKIDEVQAIIQQTGALEYTEKMAQLQAQLAIAELAHLPDSESKSMLENVARLSVHRSY